MPTIWALILAACTTVDQPCPKGYFTNDQVTVAGTVASYSMLSACTAETPCTGELTVVLYDSTNPDAAVNTEIAENLVIDASGNFSAKFSVNSHEIEGEYSSPETSEGYYDTAELTLTILDSEGNVVAGDLETIDSDGNIEVLDALDSDTCSSVDEELTVDAVFSL